MVKRFIEFLLHFKTISKHANENTRNRDQNNVSRKLTDSLQTFSRSFRLTAAEVNINPFF